MGSWLPKGFEFLSGFPERVRLQRVILTLQAVFDDSGSKGQGRWMAMAGFLAPAELMATLADEWQLCLDAAHPGRIAYFKLDEAVTLDGEFRYWQKSKRDEKIRQMAKTIDRDDLHAIGVALDLDAYQSVFGPWDEFPGGRSVRHPYIMLAMHVLSYSVGEAVKRGITKPLEIVYDEHKKYRPMFAEVFKLFREVEEAVLKAPERLAVMPFQPWFRDDKEFVMLQGADLIAGELRLASDEDKPLLNGGEPLCPKLIDKGFLKILKEPELLSIDDFVRTQLRAAGWPV